MGATRGKLLVVAALLLATAGGIGMAAWGVLRAQEDDSVFRPVVIGEGTPAPDITGPWPPPDMEARAIELARNDPQVKEWVEGHRLGSFRVDGPQTEYKEGPCSDPRFLSCVDVTAYDYTRLGAVTAVVDMANDKVVDRWIAASGGFDPFEALPDVEAILAADPEFGPEVELDADAAVKQYGDNEYGGACGMGRGDHPCALVRVTGGEGSAYWVAVDLARQEVIRVFEASELEGPDESADATDGGA